MNSLLSVASSPHVSSPDTTRKLMLDVIVALIPALGVATYFFGPRVITLTLATILFCVLFEHFYCKLMKKVSSIGDLSAVVTGMLLACCLPVKAPYWVAAIGAFFAIVIVKQLFGGLGKNFMNPALAARCFLFSFPTIMTTWAAAGEWPAVFGVDSVTSATPLASMHNGVLPAESALQLLIGQCGGSMGEVSAIMLILGGLYLVFRRVITLRIPLFYIGTVAVLTFLFPQGNDSLQWMLASLLSGGLMIGAFFMATDYVTSPVTKRGQALYAIGCGLLTVFIRYFGSYPEGVSYSIVIMNCFVWLLDKAGAPHRFGTPHLWEKANEKGGGAK